MIFFIIKYTIHTKKKTKNKYTTGNKKITNFYLQEKEPPSDDTLLGIFLLRIY